MTADSTIHWTVSSIFCRSVMIRRIHDYTNIAKVAMQNDVEYRAKINNIDMISELRVECSPFFAWTCGESEWERMPENLRIESLHKRWSRLWRWTGLLDYYLSWCAMWMKWGRRKSLIFQHCFGSSFLLLKNEISLPLALADNFPNAGSSLDYVSQVARHITWEIHKFAMSNSVKFLKFKKGEKSPRRLESWEISRILRNNFFPLVVWTLTSKVFSVVCCTFYFTAGKLNAKFQPRHKTSNATLQNIGKMYKKY